MTSVPRPEHPRPDRRRERWVTCNGPWHFAFDDGDVGRREQWHHTDAGSLADGPSPFDRTIMVPFAPQTPASGIGDRSLRPVVWYARSLPVPELGPGERLWLHVGAADHDATVWVNGEQVAHHEGGYTPLSADITDAVGGDGSDVCVVRVADDPLALDQLRGKQFWRHEPEHVFYGGVTGIWQSVWLEVVNEASVVDVVARPHLDDASVDLVVDVTAAAVGSRLRLRVTHDEVVLVDDEVRLVGRSVRRRVRLSDAVEHWDAGVIEHQGVAVWTPWDPQLHELELHVVADDGAVLDTLTTTFGMRSIEARDGLVLLNGLPVYQRLVLDQGYFPEGGYTATTDDELRRDIELAKDLGFIGCRKHQKIEDPRWLHWADRLGFLVWEELPSAYRFTPATVQRSSTTWQEAIRRDRNHPCIVVWVPANESWGTPDVAWPTAVEQHHHLAAMFHLTQSLDATRLVVSNDGWEHADTDLLTIHEYGEPASLARRLTSRQQALRPSAARRAGLAPGHSDEGQPILLSEFGGVALDGTEGWGFHRVADGERLLESYHAFVSTAVAASDLLVGFCWTQLTDVEQEVNGLLTAEREPKVDAERIRAITTLPRQGAPDGPDVLT